jgi:Domain of unknown function (DUF1996)
MAYATGANGIAKGSGNGQCPKSHPVKVPQLMLETIWDTRSFNDKSQWPKDATQPFVWSYGDKYVQDCERVPMADTLTRNGYGNHGDYVFGWKGTSLQRIVDTSCYVNCPGSKQSIAKMNKCTQKPHVKEQIDGCEYYPLFDPATHGSRASDDSGRSAISHFRPNSMMRYVIGISEMK